MSAGNRPAPSNFPRSPSLPGPAPRVLLGTAGTGTTWGIAASLRECWGDKVRLIVTDLLPGHMVATSALADQFVQMPAVGDNDQFQSALLSVMEAESVDTYVPTYDPEIVAAARLRDGGLLSGVRVLSPPLWTARTCLDKLAAACWLERSGFPAPISVPFAEDAWSGSAVIVKPRRGVGSVGVTRVDTRDAWIGWCGRDDLDGWLAQELIAGPEITLDCFRSAQGGDSRVVCRERVEVKSGVCTKARIFDDPELASLAVEIGAGLELNGVYCLQAMRSPNRGWLVTDINPRPGAGTRLSAAVGVHFQAAWLADAWGLPTTDLLPPLERERWVVRQYQEIVLA